VIILVNLGLPELTIEQKVTLCATAENAAHNYILSKVSSKMIDKLDISVEAEGFKPLNLSVEVNLILSQKAGNFDVQTLIKQAINEAYKASEDYLRKIK
jgi:hypothetical protein